MGAWLCVCQRGSSDIWSGSQWSIVEAACWSASGSARAYGGTAGDRYNWTSGPGVTLWSCDESWDSLWYPLCLFRDPHRGSGWLSGVWGNQRFPALELTCTSALPSALSEATWTLRTQFQIRTEGCGVWWHYYCNILLVISCICRYIFLSADFVSQSFCLRWIIVLILNSYLHMALKMNFATPCADLSGTACASGHLVK